MRKPRPYSADPFCRQDAERYRFLREHGFRHFLSLTSVPDRVEVGFKADGGSRAALDAAIDAAIAKKRQRR